MRKKTITLLDKILLTFLNRENPMSRVDIIKHDNSIKKGSLGAYIQRMQKEGLIERAEHGKYVLTDKGKQKLEGIKHYTPKNAVKKSDEHNLEDNSSEIKINDLDDIDLIIQLKKRYGKEELIKRLKKMIKLLE